MIVKFPVVVNEDGSLNVLPIEGIEGLAYYAHRKEKDMNVLLLGILAYLGYKVFVDKSIDISKIIGGGQVQPPTPYPTPTPTPTPIPPLPTPVPIPTPIPTPTPTPTVPGMLMQWGKRSDINIPANTTMNFIFRVPQNAKSFIITFLPMGMNVTGTLTLPSTKLDGTPTNYGITKITNLKAGGGMSIEIYSVYYNIGSVIYPGDLVFSLTEVAGNTSGWGALRGEIFY